MALVVQRHPVGTLLDDERLAGQVPIGRDGVSVGLIRFDVRHEQGPAVRRADDAIRLRQIRNHPH